jgi:alpha-mannosidase
LNPESPILNPVTVGSNFLENEFVRVEIGTDGSVISIRDKRTGQEFVDRSSRFAFGQFVCANGAQLAKSEYEKIAVRPTIKAETTGPEVGSLVITDTMSPLSRTEITLCAGSPSIHLRQTVDRRRIPKGDYRCDLAFPLSIPGGELIYDTPGGFLNRHTDCMPKGFHTVMVNHGGDITGPTNGITIFSSQGFAWEFGRINAFAEGALPPESTTLMVRLVNKIDTVQYREGVGDYIQEPGSPDEYIFDHTFMPHSGASTSNSGEEMKFLLSQSNPLIVIPIRANVEGTLPAGSGQFIDITGDEISLLAIKRAEDGDGYVVRLMETGNHAGTARIRSKLLKIGSAELLDNVERTQRRARVTAGSVRVRLGSREIVTVRVRFLKG